DESPRYQDQRIYDAILKSDHAGAVLSIGSITSMPVREANQVSKAVTLSAKTVGFSVASSAGRMQAGFVVPVSLLHSGRAQTVACCSRNTVPMRLARALARKTPSRWKIWLIRSRAWPRRSLPLRLTAIPQGTCAKPNFAEYRPVKRGSVK